MGEKPLNSLDDPHNMRFAALQLIDRENRRIQAIGRWYNMEDITLAPSAGDSRIYVPGDTIAFRAPTRNVTIRGRTLYDLENGTPLFEDSITGVLIRLIPFDDLPEQASQWIGASVILKFQADYDGDSQKTKLLAGDLYEAKVLENTEHIRNRKSNFIDANAGLQRLKSLTRGARRYVRP
jgi:hypothetical protein